MEIFPKKAVIPAAGIGTRLLPATKSQPNEMLPVGRKPVIQSVVEEIRAAGLTEILIITNQQKRYWIIRKWSLYNGFFIRININCNDGKDYFQKYIFHNDIMCKGKEVILCENFFKLQLIFVRVNYFNIYPKELNST